jgi:hypothetical protein
MQDVTLLSWKALSHNITAFVKVGIKILTTINALEILLNKTGL